MSTKLIVVVGVTGNQGGSVARQFLTDPNYRVRGITRNPSSAVAQDLSLQGVEIVTANLDDPTTLTTAFKDANVIFSVTNYWEPFFDPSCRSQAAARGISAAKFAYEVEYRQGCNVADAAATVVDSLDDNGFIVSTLSNATRASRGRHREVYHFDAKADVFPDYVREKYPELAAKMSCVYTGFFMTSYRLAPTAYFSKTGPKTFTTQTCNPPTTKIPHLDVVNDTGPFVHAVTTHLPPGKTYMASGTTCTWPEYIRLWSDVTGAEGGFRQISRDDMVDLVALGAGGDVETGREIVSMYDYSTDPGYDGGGGDVWGVEEINQAAGIDLKMTGLEEWMRRQDWSDVLNQPVTEHVVKS